MEKILTILLLLLFSVNLVMAVEVYSGESYELELDKPYEYYSIVGNSTEVNLTVTQDGNDVTIIPDKYSQSDSYEIIFFDSEKETITVYQSSGGGGSSTRWKTEYVDRNNTVTEYVDREIEVDIPGETTEIEKIVKKTSWWVWAIGIILMGIILYLLFLKKENTVERGYENNE